MLAVIILGHGSTVAGAEQDMEKVATSLRSRLQDTIIETSYLSLTPPTFEKALEKAVEQGAKKVVLIPYMLLKGTHVIKDIPRMLKEEAAKYPDVKMVYADYLGFDDLIVDLLIKRIEDAKKLI